MPQAHHQKALGISGCRTATPAQRANYTMQDRDRAISWPDLGKTIFLNEKDQPTLYVAPVAVEQPVLETA